MVDLATTAELVGAAVAGAAATDQIMDCKSILAIEARALKFSQHVLPSSANVHVTHTKVASGSPGDEERTVDDYGIYMVNIVACRNKHVALLKRRSKNTMTR